MKRHYKDIKKIMQMKWRPLTFTKKCSKKDRKEPKKASDDSSDKEQKSKNTDGKKVEKKVPKPPDFVYTDSDDSDNEQDQQPKNVPKTPEFVDIDSDDEQEPTPKQPQRASKVSDPQKASPALVKPAKIPNFAAASCAFILTKGVRKGNQCRFRVSDETGFCHHHKQLNLF